MHVYLYLVYLATCRMKSKINQDRSLKAIRLDTIGQQMQALLDLKIRSLPNICSCPV